MEIKEASAMTEASGLVSEHGQATEPRPRQSDAATIWADRLRKVTVQAPLQVLAVAFVLGMWFARRRSRRSRPRWVLRSRDRRAVHEGAPRGMGRGSNLFHQGFAKETDDSDVIAATMSTPGVVLRCPADEPPLRRARGLSHGPRRQRDGKRSQKPTRA